MWKKSKDGFDEFGNPVGKAFDLGGVDDDRLKGEKSCFIYHRYPGRLNFNFFEQTIAERKVLFDKIASAEFITKERISAYSQIWLVSDVKDTLTPKNVDVICDFVRSGNGIFLLTDNDPVFCDANLIAHKLFAAEFSGDKHGDGIMEPGNELKPGVFIDHPITQGVNRLYEGITICTISPTRQMKIVAMSHDGQNAIGCYEHQNIRAVFSTGYTKFYDDRFTRTTGTARYIRNIAFWLSRGARNVEYKSLPAQNELVPPSIPAGHRRSINTTSPSPSI